ncbi:hypothetical protein [Thermococcus sp. Bubb.Bath]|uniref:hypothetical protein n=1 Tax=Thermococcus sp. Bubb.Bath TaxID=1638242 RepID=UPI00143A59C9|nr:hypothetical protein [Thermococcus sp. Bubb.Bath]NJF25176.1 hypothetical protein [Thermococcus sp. Bubb.Bath]
MVAKTVQITRRGPGRPKTRDTELITLNLDRKALTILRELSQKHGMPMNQTLKTLLFSAANDDYPLKLSQDNNHLREQLRTCENRVRELESELEKIRSRHDLKDRELKELMELKVKIGRILERHGELKLFELVGLVSLLLTKFLRFFLLNKPPLVMLAFIQHDLILN